MRQGMAKGRKRKTGTREQNGRLLRIGKLPKFERSWVYILKIEGQSLFKIGKADDIDRRLSSYKTHLPYDFYILDKACFDTPSQAFAAEKWILQNLKENPSKFIHGSTFKHKIGEWFQADLADFMQLISQTAYQIPWEQPHKEMRA